MKTETRYVEEIVDDSDDDDIFLLGQNEHSIKDDSESSSSSSESSSVASDQEEEGEEDPLIEDSSRANAGDKRKRKTNKPSPAKVPSPKKAKKGADVQKAGAKVVPPKRSARGKAK